MPSFASTQNGYGNLWRKAVTRSERVKDARDIAGKILANRSRYAEIEKLTKVPYFMIGPLHMRESSMSFTRHLHNGDPLGARTIHIPAGRPIAGSPPFDFEESAIDALTMPPHELHRVEEWSIARILYESEKYNGFGYFLHGINSPYLWSWTNLQQPGKYTSDGNLNPSVMDTQPGVVAILKELEAMDEDVRIRIAGEKPPAPPPPPPPQPSVDVAAIAGLLRTASDSLSQALKLLEK